MPAIFDSWLKYKVIETQSLFKIEDMNYGEGGSKSG